MKYLTFFTALLFVPCCTPLQREMATPRRIQLQPSVEWEVVEGQNTKTKPKLSLMSEWMF